MLESLNMNGGGDDLNEITESSFTRRDEIATEEKINHIMRAAVKGKEFIHRVCGQRAASFRREQSPNSALPP